jgi:hypothetical protein
MTMRSFKHLLMGVGSAGLLVTASCGDVVRQGTGSAYLIIDSLLGARGGTQSPTFSNVVQSDVLTNGGVYEDLGRVTLRLAGKDVTSPLSTNNFVTINRYRVVYRRADGRNQQGIDVPYAFDGGVTLTVSDTAAVQATFTLVRVQAKFEPPLITLFDPPVPFGGAIAISTLADVTFYGRDQTGHEMNVTGTLSVNFSDWADPSSGTEGN